MHGHYGEVWAVVLLPCPSVIPCTMDSVYAYSEHTVSLPLPEAFLWKSGLTVWLRMDRNCGTDSLQAAWPNISLCTASYFLVFMYFIFFWGYIFREISYLFLQIEKILFFGFFFFFSVSVYFLVIFYYI